MEGDGDGGEEDARRKVKREVRSGIKRDVRRKSGGR